MIFGDFQTFIIGEDSKCELNAIQTAFPKFIWFLCVHQVSVSPGDAPDLISAPEAEVDSNLK